MKAGQKKVFYVDAMPPNNIFLLVRGNDLRVERVGTEGVTMRILAIAVAMLFVTSNAGAFNEIHLKNFCSGCHLDGVVLRNVDFESRVFDPLVVDDYSMKLVNDYRSQTCVPVFDPSCLVETC